MGCLRKKVSSIYQRKVIGVAKTKLVSEYHLGQVQVFFIKKVDKGLEINFPLTDVGNLTSEMLGLANRALAMMDNLAKLKLKETISNK